ncbi:MAG: hypothetical protein ACP5MH_10015 [Thermoproteus sp.]
MSRSTVPVEGDVARELSIVAKSQGFSVLRLASDSLRLALELLKRGITPTRAIEMWRLTEKIAAFDAMPVPLSYLELVAKKWGVCDDLEVEAFLREIGAKFGKIAAGEFRSFGEFMSVATQFLSMLPVARLSLSRDGNSWRIVFTSAGASSARCLGYFAEEAIKQFGCAAKISYGDSTITAEITC